MQVNPSLPMKLDIGSPVDQDSLIPLHPPPRPYVDSSIEIDARQKTFDAISALRQTRKLLGDLNDDYTAYKTYVESGTNESDQVQLISRIETLWNNFRWWAKQIDLNEQIDFLKNCMVAGDLVMNSDLVKDDNTEIVDVNQTQENIDITRGKTPQEVSDNTGDLTQEIKVTTSQQPEEVNTSSDSTKNQTLDQDIESGKNVGQ